MRTKTKNEIKALVKPYIEIVNLVGENTLSPVWAIKDILGAVYSSQKQIHFQDFVEGIAYYFATNSLSDDDVRALMKKVSDSKNYETMTNILDSVFFSHSKISRAILGIITGKFLHDDTLDYEDMVIVGALKDLFDEDLNQFWRYCSFKPNASDDRTSIMSHFSATDRLIIEKLQNAGVLGRDLAGNRLGGAMLRFELTIVSKKLRTYLEAIRPIFVDERGEINE